MVSEGVAPTALGHGLSVQPAPAEVTLPPEQGGPSTSPLPAGPVSPPASQGPSPLDMVPGQEQSRHRTPDLAADLFRRWADGDAWASHELVALLTPVLWHTARAYRLDGATAEDVVQNAWLALARRRDQLRDPQAVMAWLLVTVRRDAARTAASTRGSVPDPERVLARSADPAPGPAATVVAEDRARRLWSAVGRLSERCQRLLRVVAFSDRPDYASLSLDLGMPLGSIGPTRGRCLKKLRADLDAQGEWTA